MVESTPSRWCAVAVGIAAGCYFGWAANGIASEPAFADEAAVLGQTYFFRLAKVGDFSHPDWASHAAFDHQPLYKYWIGAALEGSGRRSAIPDSLAPWKRWMNGVHDPEVNDALIVARCATAMGAGLACAFVCLFAARMHGALAGILAAAAFASSPLIFVHARRAMIDVASQGFAVGVLACAAALAASKTWRGALLAGVGVAVVGALGPLAKWNAAVGCLSVAAVALLTLVVGSWRARGQALGMTAALASAGAFFFLLDPFYWAKIDPVRLAETLASSDPDERPERLFLANATPWQRARHALDYRQGSLAGAAQQFPNDYLPATERLQAVVVQGMGRWSLGNRRYTVEEAKRPRPQRTRLEDWVRAAILLPLAAIGWLSAARGGWRQRSAGAFPTAWLLAAWPAADLALTLPNLTLDWDRYYLGTVTWSSVAAACGVAAVARGFAGALKLPARALTQT